MRADSTVIETAAFAGLPTVAGSGRGVIATERDGLAIARVAARRGQSAKVVELFRARFGIELPQAARRASLGDVGVAGIAPQAWLATRDGAGNEFAPSLRSLLGDCASVSDQSDAYVMLRLTGPKVRATLAKLLPIDVHPRSFPVGGVAQTVCGYVNVMLWRLEDAAQGEATFEVWAGRSFAISLHRAISHSAAEFGFVRQTA